MTITLYGSKNTRAFRCFWMLEELEIDYRIKEVRVHKGEGRAPDYLSIIPTGRCLRSKTATSFFLNLPPSTPIWRINSGEKSHSESSHARARIVRPMVLLCDE